MATLRRRSGIATFAFAALGVLQFIWNRVSDVQTAQGIYDQRGSLIELLQSPWATLVPFAVFGFCYLFVRYREAHPITDAQDLYAGLPDLEVIVGGFLIYASNDPSNYPNSSFGITRARVVNRRNRVSLRFQLRNPRTGATLEPLSKGRIQKIAPPMSEDDSVQSNPLQLDGPNETTVVLWFAWDGREGQLTTVYSQVVVSDALSGKKHTIDLTADSPDGAPFRRRVAEMEAVKVLEAAPAPTTAHDLEIAVGPMLVGLCKTTNSIESETPATAFVAFMVRVANRKKAVSLTFALSKRQSEETLLAVSRNSDIELPKGVPIIDQPLTLNTGIQIFGNLFFVWPSGTYGQDRQIHLEFPNMSVFDSIAGRYYTIDLTKTGANDSPFRREVMRTDVTPTTR